MFFFLKNIKCERYPEYCQNTHYPLEYQRKMSMGSCGQPQVTIETEVVDTEGYWGVCRGWTVCSAASICYLHLAANPPTPPWIYYGHIGAVLTFIDIVVY